MRAMETREIKGKVFAAFGGYTWAKGSVMAEIGKFSERMNMPVVASMAMRQTLDDASRAEARALAASVASALTLK